MDGDGEVQRCHFLPQRLGNLYADRLEDMLVEKPCSRLRKCDCFIGYAHRQELPFYDDFGAGQARLLELAEAPPHYLKFDHRFISGLDQAPLAKRRLLQSLAFGPSTGAGEPVAASTFPLVLHMIIVLIAGVWLPEPLVEWFQSIAKLIG